MEAEENSTQHLLRNPSVESISHPASTASNPLQTQYGSISDLVTPDSMEPESQEPDDLVDDTEVSEELCVIQACVFLEDAVEYRSIHHRVDMQSLRMYRIYYSKPIQWLLISVLSILHLLAFIEFPSSLTVSSDIRYKQRAHRLPCGVTESIEIVCLIILTSDLLVKSYLKGKAQFMRSKWLWAACMVLFISYMDWFVSVGMHCADDIRLRRMFRPFFLLQNSSLMKKTVNCLRKTVPHVVSVLLLLFLHLYFFTLFGMLLFATIKDEERDYFRNPLQAFLSLLVLLTTANNPDITMPAYRINRFYAAFFIVYLIIGLYCLMNMLTAVIYNQFRGYFTDSIQASVFRRRLGIRAMYEVLRRKNTDLGISSGVEAGSIQSLMKHARIPKQCKTAILNKLCSVTPGGLLDFDQVQSVFSVLDLEFLKDKPELVPKNGVHRRRFQKMITHRYFSYVGCMVAGVNVICITLELGLEYDKFTQSRDTYLGILNILFVIYFAVEQVLKVWAFDWHCYSHEAGNLMDGIITILLVIVQGVYVAIYGIPFLGEDKGFSNALSLWDLVRIINILIMIRLLRMITEHIKAMSIVSSTLFDLLKNLRAFGGILVVIYYTYALLGVELFHGKITYANESQAGNETLECGSYKQLGYWANNFDDFGAALIVLWDVMVVNNWHVFMEAYKEATIGWSQLYFVAWWIISVVISMNLFTALILENFIMRWDRQVQVQTLRYQQLHNSVEQLHDPSAQLHDSTAQLHHMGNEGHFTIHDMFRVNLHEPTEEVLSYELYQHPYFDCDGI